MDPDANLDEQLTLARDIVNDIDDEGKEPGYLTYDYALSLANDGARLAELVLELNEWRLKGGATPEAQKV